MLLALAAGCPGGGDGGGGGGGGGTQVTLNGTVTYDFVPATYARDKAPLDFAATVKKPVRNAVVQVRQGTKVLATTNTDEQGKYQLSFLRSLKGSTSLEVLAKTSNPQIQVEDNTDGNAIWAIGTSTLPTTDSTLNLHAGHGWTGTAYDATLRTAAPFAVLDSMYTAARSFMAVRTVTFPALKVNWSPDNVPQGGDKSAGFISTSHFSPSENEIYILGKEGADTDEFDAHVIVHEWGHYFESNLSRSDSPGGPHGRGDVLDPRIAFGEGYGNALAAMLLPEPLYVDTVWAGAGGTLASFGIDAENEPLDTDDPTPGVFSESSVHRLLYDIFDSGTAESYDKVAAGLGPIYDVLVGTQKTTDSMTTIASFVAALKAQPGVNAADVNTLLARYQMGAIASEWGDGDTKMRNMYAEARTLPYSNNIAFEGGYEYNTWQQNQYYVFTGNGSRVTVSASSPADDVGITVYQRGKVVGQADETLVGTETLSLTTQQNSKYVVVLTGFKESTGEYNVAISIKSP
ncbi:hypothetical protein [Archangium violaceum]|uniref:hypothetical protein n=1 Tax=Archangium violaceum TaxID=83451 RepID=UPI0036DC70C0